MTIETVLLGSGNPLPDPNRAGPATLVRAGGRTLLFDAGRGVCMRMAAVGVLPIMLDAVFVTHLHSDHICDLADVISTQWVMSPDRRALRVLGPARTSDVVDGITAMLAPDIGYRLAHHADLEWAPQVQVTELDPGVALDDGEIRVVAAASDHRPVEPSLAFRVEHGGNAVVVAGDTLPCPALAELCAGADVYVQTVLRDDLVNLVPSQRFRDTVDYHSTVEQAARTAAEAGVGTLVLTHQVPGPVPGPGDEWTAIAARHFGGTIVFGEDLTTVTVPGD